MANAKRKTTQAQTLQSQNLYVRIVIVSLLLYGLAQFVPELVNALLTFVLISMIVMQAEAISGLIAQLSR